MNYFSYIYFFIKNRVFGGLVSLFKGDSNASPFHKKTPDIALRIYAAEGGYVVNIKIDRPGFDDVDKTHVVGSETDLGAFTGELIEKTYRPTENE